ncbi:hypothetical protein JKF63_06336 [Porcisia hertigi]|uniref:Uncharacterized protein n=1 Tax=Porcisia hertigi TaxID=2761500 RepID=A0A836LEU6_9TRYP|nr:hypothetical protein JKF63_06336 [Porcisia hertigi]
MDTVVAAEGTGATEEVMDASLDEYFAVCRESSSSSLVAASSRSSSLSEPNPECRSLEPSSPGVAVIARNSTTAPHQPHHSKSRRDAKTAALVAGSLPNPMQGNATRPLLQRSQPPRDSLLANVLISIPTTMDEDGTAPSYVSTPPHSSDHPARPAQRLKSVVPPQASAAAPLREGVVMRGSASHTLAERLQNTTLPYAPFSGPSTPLSLTVNGSRAAPPGWARSAFMFQTPQPADTAAASQGKTRSFITITTQGGPSRCPPSTPPSSSPRTVAAAEVDRLARQRALLFDVLCALRQHPTASCEMCLGTRGSRGSAHADPSAVSHGGKWRMRDAVLAEAATKMWSPTFLGVLERLLDMANVVAAVDAHVRQCETALSPQASCISPEAHETFGCNATEDCRGIQNASVALDAAAVRSLQRLCSVLRQLSVDFSRWVLQVQEYLLVLCESAATAFPDEHILRPMTAVGGSHEARIDLANEEATPTKGAVSQPHVGTASHTISSSRVASTVLPPSCSLADLVAAVCENILPLQRCHVLIEESGCFDGLVSLENSSPAEGPAATANAAPASFAGKPVSPRTCSHALLAARLLDTLIIKASALQDTSTMDLYRFYVMILLYTAWPYVLLCTAAIFGFVRGIDPSVWRRQLPRLFRSSFSHVRISDASRCCPTDILSLLLNCVGFYSADDVAVSPSSEEHATGAAQRKTKTSPSNASARDGFVGTPGAPAPRQTDTSSSGRRRGDTSELHVARAALTSARVFVLRSLASFTRRRKQVALSRTPMHPRRPPATLAGVTGNKAVTTSSRPSSGTAPSRLWHTMSVKEILHNIMYDSGDQSGHGGVADIVVYAQQNQDVRRRVVQVEAASSTAGGNTGASHYAYFPTTIPLGFSAMTTEALAGQQQWQKRRCDCGASGATGEEGSFTPSSPLYSPRQRRAAGGGEGSGRLYARMRPGSRSSTAALDDDDDGGGGDDGANGGSGVLRRRGIALWTLAINESAAALDVRFMNALADEEERFRSVEGGGSTASELSGREQGKRRPHQLWINVTIPCARWITTALLIPIGVAVQRLQERRLRDLFKPSLPVVLGGCNFSLSPAQESTQESQQLQGQSRGTTAPVGAPSSNPLTPLNGLAGTGLSGSTPTTVQCTFMNALKLLVDIALCRDQERLVHGFLERLHREPRWWVRHAEDGGVAAFRRLGTAAPLVSAIFRDALRGKHFSELVRLSVLPARGGAAVAAAATSGTPGAAAPAPGQTGRGSSGHSLAADMLDVFASFRLDFSLPDAFQRVLRPRDLSVYVQSPTNTVERSYETDFWQRRLRLYVSEGNAEQERSLVSTAAAGSDGVAFADVWSYIFGYKCALYYAQITLREHKKLLHQRDAQDAQVAQNMGLPGRSATQHLRYVSRGLGSAYYTLSFAVDQLLHFTQNVAVRVVYDLQRLLANATNPSSKLFSCMDLCYQLDALLLDLSFVSFPARPPVAVNVRERAMQSPATEVVRAAVQRTLEVALDPSRLPVSHISSSTRNAVEALVAAVSVSAEHHPSALATHLQPLVVRLTFNRYYGTDEATLSFHFR